MHIVADLHAQLGACGPHLGGQGKGVAGEERGVQGLADLALRAPDPGDPVL